MKKVFFLSLLFLGGCNNFNRLIGIDDPTKAKAQSSFYIVACCRDTNQSFPSSVPQSHRDFCVQVEKANFLDQKINNDIYLASHNDCEQTHKIGSQYYL